MSSAVVFVHPCAESFTAAVLERVVRGLESAGSTVETIDLYADGYHPGTDLPQRHREVLDHASTLVLVYPTWWTTQPAILLGWLTAAMVEGAASIATLVCVTTHGGPRLGNLIAGQSGRHTAARVVRSRCARGALFHWVALYELDKGDEQRRLAFLARVERELGRLARRDWPRQPSPGDSVETARSFPRSRPGPTRERADSSTDAMPSEENAT